MSLQKFPPFTYHQELECQISYLDEQGSGVADIGGQLLRIPFTLPGEQVRARVYANRNPYSEADLLHVLKPSPYRVEPKCLLFGVCSGCQLQHLAYEQQLIWKQKQIEKLFFVFKEAKLNSIMGSPHPYAYRSKLTPHFNRPRKTEEYSPIGFLKIGRRSELVDVPTCPIATDPINHALPRVRKEFQEQMIHDKRGGTLLLREGLEGIVTQPDSVVSEKINDLILKFPAGDFFQNNPFLLPKLIEYVATQAKEGGARFLVDAYCGSGLFALSLASHFKQVAGVEISQRSVNWARKNAESNNISNCLFHLGNAAELFKHISFPNSQTVIIIDPPRKGCDELFLEQLRAFAPVKIIYISCNPTTQARDLSQLSDYHITQIQPFDLFPQTRHVECIAVLERQPL